MPNYIKRIQTIQDTAGQSRVDRKVKPEEVVICFLKADFQRKNANYGKLPSQIEELETLDLKALLSRIGENRHFKESPVSHWTRNEDSVEQWFFIKEVPLKDCWTWRINTCLKGVVAEEEGNLCRIAKSEDPKALEEFEDRTMPPPNKRTLIGLLQRKSNRQGKIQIIDGAHRLVAMYENRVRKTDMYLGKLTAKSHRAESHRNKRSWDPWLRKPPKYNF